MHIRIAQSPLLGVIVTIDEEAKTLFRRQRELDYWRCLVSMENPSSSGLDREDKYGCMRWVCV